ncbi:DLW-39 family protein [Zhihengliuella sp.]|nr:DLW-39 family protein [Zhihengliuella sp.]
MRRFIVLVTAAAAGVFAFKKWRESEAEKSVWDQATDRVD